MNCRRLNPKTIERVPVVQQLLTNWDEQLNSSHQKKDGLKKIFFALKPWALNIKKEGHRAKVTLDLEML